MVARRVHQGGACIASKRRTEFQEPPFSVRVEEGVRQVVAVVLGDLKGLVLDAVVQVLHKQHTCSD